MAGLWKAWKTQSRLPTLSTSPLGISPRAGEIPTFPQRRRLFLFLKNKKQNPGDGLRHPPARQKSPPSGADLSQTRPTKGDIAQQPHFQAHPALESKSCFRLIAHWNQSLISGSFVDWKMLHRKPQGPQLATGATGARGSEFSLVAYLPPSNTIRMTLHGPPRGSV